MTVCWDEIADWMLMQVFRATSAGNSASFMLLFLSQLMVSGITFCYGDGNANGRL